MTPVAPGGGALVSGLGVPASLPIDPERSSCFCFESDDDSTEKMRLKYTKRKLARGCLSNMAICIILVGYTFLGAIMFLAIEGGYVFYGLSRGEIGGAAAGGAATLPASPAFASVSPRVLNSTTWIQRLADEPRARTVENIWEITVKLNILYKENWTRLAGLEIQRFQESLVKRITEEISFRSGPARSELRSGERLDWTLGRAFLYSLTILTTIGYGWLGPKTGLGKAVTMGYAALGIPLVLLYLSSVGSLLSSCARNIFTRSLCCCLCSKCGYCCYDEKRMEEKERRMRRKRERQEYEQRLRAEEPFYVRSASGYTTSTTNNLISPLDESKVPTRSASILETDCLSTDTSLVETKSSSFLAPILLCVIVMIIYIGGGAFILFSLENSWTYFESVFFCFMVLSTIGFGDSSPEDGSSTHQTQYKTPSEEITVWFCSVYILCGLALTSMCFNVVHEEIAQRLKSHYIIVNNVANGSKENSVNSFKLTNTARLTEEPPASEYLPS